MPLNQIFIPSVFKNRIVLVVIVNATRVNWAKYGWSSLIMLFFYSVLSWRWTIISTDPPKELCRSTFLCDYCTPCDIELSTVVNLMLSVYPKYNQNWHKIHLCISRFYWHKMRNSVRLNQRLGEFERNVFSCEFLIDRCERADLKKCNMWKYIL